MICAFIGWLRRARRPRAGVLVTAAVPRGRARAGRGGPPGEVWGGPGLGAGVRSSTPDKCRRDGARTQAGACSPGPPSALPGVAARVPRAPKEGSGPPRWGSARRRGRAGGVPPTAPSVRTPASRGGGQAREHVGPLPPGPREGGEGRGPPGSQRTCCGDGAGRAPVAWAPGAPRAAWGRAPGLRPLCLPRGRPAPTNALFADASGGLGGDAAPRPAVARPVRRFRDCPVRF